MDSGLQRQPPGAYDAKRRDMETEAKLARAKKGARREKRRRLWNKLRRRG